MSKIEIEIEDVREIRIKSNKSTCSKLKSSRSMKISMLTSETNDDKYFVSTEMGIHNSKIEHVHFRINKWANADIKYCIENH